MTKRADEPSGDLYRATWTRLRRARIGVLVSWLLWLPVVGALTSVAGVPDVLVYLVMGALASGLWYSGARIGYTRCPRCKEHFAWHHVSGRKLLTPRCLYCGLEQWSTSHRE
jgi:hypothetical protein